MDFKTQLVLISSVCWFLAVASLVLISGPAWDHMTKWRFKPLEEEMERLRIDTSRLWFYLRLWGLSLWGIIVVVGWMLHMWILAVTALALAYFAPYFMLKRIVARRRERLRDQMVGTAIGLANAARAGLSLAQAVEGICEDSPDPIRGELRRIVFDWHRGRPLMESIRETQERLDIDAFTLFALAIEASMERGGNVSQALERISFSLSENQRLERKLEADTASGRKLVVILAAFPFVFLGGFYLLDPTGTSLLFETIAGQMILFVVIALVAGSAYWCSKILAIEG